MANKFKALAQEATALCPIMQGREKISTDDVINKEYTVIGFGFAPKFEKDGTPIVDENTGEAETFGVIIFDELPDKYYSVGTVFTKVCRSWAAAYNGDTEAASEDLKKEGGVRVRFVKTKTKGGNNLVSVQII